MRKRLISLAAILAVVVAVGAAFWYFTRPVWPEFSATTDKEPQVIVKVERDYAHHLGDLIEVQLFVRQAPGTLIDTNTLSIGGDFELAEKPAISQKDLKDGSTVYRFGLAIQSFRAQKEQVLEGTLSYRVDDKRQDLTIKPLTLHTSNTWDGRKELMEGADPRVPVLWYTLRHAIPLTLSSLLFLALTVVAFRHWLKTRVKGPVIDPVYERAVVLTGLIKNGQSTRAEHLELDGLVRARFSIGPIPGSQLKSNPMYESNAARFLASNEPAVYSDQLLTDEERATLWKQAEAVLTRWQRVPRKHALSIA